MGGGRLTKEEKAFKLKALRVALILLEKNVEKINIPFVLKKANEIGCPKYFETPIGIASLKSPKTDEFIAIVDKIEKKEEEIKKFKNSVNSHLSKKIYKLNKKVKDLTFVVAELLEQNRIQTQIINEKEKSLELLRNERESLLKRINGNKQYGN